MSKTYLQESHIAESATQLAHALGLSNKSVQEVIRKLRVREIGPQDEVFVRRQKNGKTSFPISLRDIVAETGLDENLLKSYLSTKYGLTLPVGTYCTFLDVPWKFKEND